MKRMRFREGIGRDSEAEFIALGRKCSGKNWEPRATGYKAENLGTYTR